MLPENTPPLYSCNRPDNFPFSALSLSLSILILIIIIITSVPRLLKKRGIYKKLEVKQP